MSSSSLSFARPPWLPSPASEKEDRKEAPMAAGPAAAAAATKSARRGAEKDTEAHPPHKMPRQPAVSPLLSPQYYMMSHERLRCMVHKIVRQAGLKEVNKDIYDLLQQGLVIRTSTVLERMSHVAKHRRSADSKILPSGHGGVIRRRDGGAGADAHGTVGPEPDEEMNSAAKEDEDEEGAIDGGTGVGAPAVGTAAPGRKRKRKPGKDDDEFFVKTESMRRDEEQRRQNTMLALITEGMGRKPKASPAASSASAPSPSSSSSLALPLVSAQQALSPEWLQTSLAKIETTLTKIGDQLAKVSWNHKRAAEMRRMEARLDELNNDGLATLQDLRWRFEAYQLMLGKQREEERKRDALYARDPERVRAKEEARAREKAAAEAERIERNKPREYITLRDVEMCADAFGLHHVIERCQARAAVQLATAREEAAAGGGKKRKRMRMRMREKAMRANKTKTST